MFKRSLLALTVVFATSQVQALSLPTLAGLRSACSTVAQKAVACKEVAVATAKKAGNSVVNNASAFATLISNNRKSAVAVVVAAISGGYLLARGAKLAVKAYKARQAARRS